jgi:hypothetical protein
MFERVSQVAEALATGMTRRRFLGSFGRWAGATALAMAGVLTTAGTARAGNQVTCCQCLSLDGICISYTCVQIGQPCRPCGGLAGLFRFTAKNCDRCKC